MRLILLILALLASPAFAKPTLEEQVKAHVASLAPSRTKAMLEHALTLLGTRYKWGGDDLSADGGFDCAGLAYYSFHRAGLEFPLARFSTINMTDKPRDKAVPDLWWTKYVEDFKKTMTPCDGGPYEDGDALVYHELDGGKIVDRTGHLVIVVDAKKGYALSAASAGVKLHALGTAFERYERRTLTGCWRAPSAAKAPYQRADVTWALDLPSGRDGSLQAPYELPNPVSFTFSVKGPAVKDLTLDVSGRVLSFISFVSPKVEEIATAEAATRRFRVTHDFKAVDLPVDPGEKIQTPKRKLVLRLLDASGLVAAERDFYVQIRPYW